MSRLRISEAHRFRNEPVDLIDGLHWNITGLYEEVLGGIERALQTVGSSAESIGIDSWAVDYGLIDTAGALLGLPYHYRDVRTAVGVSAVHDVVSPTDLYAGTGVQFLPFNTIYQLAAERRPGSIDLASRVLLIPDLLGYWLTGGVGAEVTNASTTGLFDVRGRRWNLDLADRLGFDRRLFADATEPGTVVGPLRTGVFATAADHIHVVRVASHDTASAVVAVPATTDDWAFISSGTWSLVGVELDAPITTEASRTANFSNELGVDGTVRYLRNVMGLWLLQETMRCLEAQGKRWDLAELVAAGGALPAGGPVIDPDDARLLPPGDMPGRIRQLCVETGQQPPSDDVALARCIHDSLAAAHARTLDEIEQVSGRRIRTVHVVGGGSPNAVLCQLTADASGRTVVAGPQEATAIGNVLVRARAARTITGDLPGMRTLVATSTDTHRYDPRPMTGR